MLSYNVLNSWVEKMMKKSLPVKIKTSNITTLSTKDINKLKAGDIVLKKTGNQKHAYIVSYKEENQGICLTYADATYIETVSYNYNATTKQWVYNSKDSTVVASKNYVDSLMSGALKREIIETLPTEDIDTNTIYMVLNSEASTEGNVYDEYMYINNAWELIGTTATVSETKLYLHNVWLHSSSGNTCDIQIKIYTTSATPLTLSTLNTFIGNNMYYNCIGFFTHSNAKYPIQYIYRTGTNNFVFATYTESAAASVTETVQTNNLAITDTVKEV